MGWEVTTTTSAPRLRHYAGGQTCIAAADSSETKLVFSLPSLEEKLPHQHPSGGDEEKRGENIGLMSPPYASFQGAYVYVVNVYRNTR
nr:uncharacterized protein CTRU02_08000 [Colletotrichum truncatum]KAF6790480.1 hypothetical protein CTRU02_08000 [Colletotrichum truncatum]